MEMEEERTKGARSRGWVVSGKAGGTREVGDAEGAEVGREGERGS